MPAAAPRETEEHDLFGVYEGSETISRREALGWIAAAAVGLGLSAAGVRITHNEIPSYYDEDLLLQAARRSPVRKQIGMYPDFDAGDAVAWQQVKEYQEEIGQVDALGFFSLLEDLSNPARRAWIERTMTEITARSARIVWSLGTGSDFWRHRGHPFSLQNRALLQEGITEALDTMERLQVSVDLRMFFEANLPVFSFGTGQQLSHAEHIRAYNEIFLWSREEIDRRKQRNPSFDAELLSSPYARGDVKSYATRLPNGQTAAHAVGIDVYSLFPGKGQWLHPHYWYPGYQTPEQVIFPALQGLRAEIPPQTHLDIAELGAISRDATWLRQAYLLLYALGGRRVMYFDYDKSHTGLPYESNWRMTPEIKLMLRTLMEQLRSSDALALDE